MMDQNNRTHQSEFERLREERRRYFATKREARSIKRGEPQDHPWITAAKERRTQAEQIREFSPARKRPFRRGLWIGGLGIACAVALVTLLFLPHSSANQEGGATASPPSVVRVWHNLTTTEATELKAVADRFESKTHHADIVYQKDLPITLRTGILTQRAPDIAIVDELVAQELAAGNLLVPFPTRADPSIFYMPLAPRSPWSRPLVAVILKSRGRADTPEYVRKFAESLSSITVSDRANPPGSTND